MKRLLIMALGGLLAGGLALAADQESSGSSETDHSHNPITGSDTTTKTTKHKVKGADGSEHKMKKVVKTKKKSDGGTEKSSKTEESNSPAD
jgi:hypothetical protein